MKVCHMTSAHPQEDIRIFLKECVSLAQAGHEVFLVSCGSEYKKNGVHMVGIGPQENSRRKRMTRTAKRVYKAAKKIGLKLKHAGKKVIFDSHEDVAAQIRDKTWIPKWLRKIVAKIYGKYEAHVVKRLDAVVAATPHIAKVFTGVCKKVVVVNNYPKLDDIKYHQTPFSEREAQICYAGGIDQLRGEQIMIEAMKGTSEKMIVAGNHEIMEIQ